ncbi:MAG: hypothetical protein LBR90_00035, partial [Elusimicrobiota bacterium]|jgi:nucleoside-diphosphate kinase|nr:hypothetical protein [Elusimicrobiota bacterium]
MKERTLVLIKPDAISKRLSGVIIDRLERLGLTIKAAKVVTATDALIRRHYAHLAGAPFMDDIVAFMLGKFNDVEDSRLYAFVFEGPGAVAKVRGEAGATDPDKALPHTIRGAFGQIKDGVMQNCLHASAGAQEAKDEIKLWFGDI